MQQTQSFSSRFIKMKREQMQHGLVLAIKTVLGHTMVFVF